MPSLKILSLRTQRIRNDQVVGYRRGRVAYGPTIGVAPHPPCGWGAAVPLRGRRDVRGADEYRAHSIDHQL